ncbi:hypothetical protein B296_00048384 [Ensete ventricosum]|uniref:Protein kinase domain-containing protein n=1 Tax=Ensete ventricosum TaxID=4639 RepID=A0A426X2P8_ENSVE|nr:hypothetical protein B296_00048384 [Ensete ventricosum]
MSCLHPSRTGGSSYVAVPQLRCFPHPAHGPPAPAWACGSRKLSTVPGIIRKVFGTGKIRRFALGRRPTARTDHKLRPTATSALGISHRFRPFVSSKGMGRNGTVRRSYSASSADYRLLEEVGYGASATVYRAIYLPTKEIVAVKRLDLDRCNSNFVSPSLTVSFVSGDSSRCCGGVGWGCE